MRADGRCFGRCPCASVDVLHCGVRPSLLAGESTLLLLNATTFSPFVCSNPPELRSQAPRAIVRDDGSIKSGAAYDGQKFDVFAAGCMLYALLAGRQPPGSPLHGYPGRFVDSTGAGMERLSPLAVALLGRMCDTNPATRCSALEALQHPYFDGVAVPAAMWPPGAAAGLPHGIRRAAGAGAPAPADAARGIAGGAGAAPV